MVAATVVLAVSVVPAVGRADVVEVVVVEVVEVVVDVVEVEVVVVVEVVVLSFWSPLPSSSMHTSSSSQPSPWRY